MSWRTVVIKNRSKLDLRMGYLVIRNEEIKKIYLDEIAVLIIESTAVSLTAALLSELIKHKVKVIFCDEKRNPESELMPYYGSHDTSIRVRSQVGWSESTAGAVWTEIVREKIRKQSEVLKAFDKDEYKMLDDYISEIEFYDTTNREGHAAKVYFNALFGKDFTRNSEDHINSSLNYGYTIILSMFNRIIAANGYITQIGIFHDNMFNDFNLACDLMEPFRPLVDREVYSMCPQSFGWEEKERLINILNSEVIIDKKKHHCLYAAEIYARSVFTALEQMDVSLIKTYEL